MTETAYMVVRAALEPCRTLKDLAAAWAKNQTSLLSMDKEERAALVAMKDFYKGMIKRGEIDAYLQSRAWAKENQV